MPGAIHECTQGIDPRCSIYGASSIVYASTHGNNKSNSNGVTGHRVSTVSSAGQYACVDDVIDALLMLMNVQDTPSIFNIAHDQEVSPREVMRAILSFFPERKMKLQQASESMYREIRNQSIDASKLKSLGWKAKVSLETGLERMVGW